VRALPAPASAVLGGRLGMTQLVEMNLGSGFVRVALCRDTIEWDGKLFLGGRQASIDPIRDQGGQMVAQAFQLSGVNADMLSIALAEQVQGRPVKVWTAILDPDTQLLLDVRQSWSGTLDQMPISQQGAQATITVTAEHRGITFARPKGLRYTDSDQQALFPGDRGLEFIIAQATHQDVWPSAAFFRQ